MTFFMQSASLSHELAVQVRGSHQGGVREVVLKRMRYDQAVLILDYKMKQEPQAHAEAWSELCGKRGISVHGAVALARSLPKHLLQIHY